MGKLAVKLIVFLIVFQLTAPAFGWGNTGHRTVGQIAQSRLANTNTLLRIQNILRPGESLSSVANWADDVKEEERFKLTATHPDPDTQDFYRHMVNQHNRKWHFVDLPLNCSGYGDPGCKKFTSGIDIVQIINLCIRRLRGDPVANNAPHLTKRNALRMLVHLVGDLHQPLHVGVGFVNAAGGPGNIVIVRQPASIIENDFPSDHGGNNLLIANEVSDNLHSFWDTDLVDAAIGNQSLADFSNSLIIQAPPDWNATGNASTWAAQWAGDTLHISSVNAYDDTIKPTKEVIIDDRTKYLTDKGPNYKNNNIPVVKLQLAKGGYRLAQLLRAIFP
jgi:hypothetical protein